MPPARIGTEFAGYRIDALLGRGGTSTVYRAENPRLGIPLALKLLNPEVAEDESFRERFVRESRLAAGINHPNIIPIYDAGVWEDTLFIAMRLVAGGDLKARLVDGPLPATRALSILAQVGSGLDAAHGRGLVHRDVKPANLMVDSGPGPDAPEIAYVTDFGLIKNVHSGGRPTPTGEFLGTISYVAPEQIEGRPIDSRIDLYSLGCVAFECLTGQVPFERENDAAILWAHMQEEPPSASELVPELPAGVDAPLAKAMAKRPEDRFSTCGELVASLRDELDSDTARRVSLTLPLRRPSSARPRSALGRLAALAAGLVLGAGAATAALSLAGDGDGGGGVTVTRSTTVSRTVTGPTESRLIAVVPESFRSRCSRATVPTPDFDESVTCRPGRGVAVVRYSHSLSGPLLTDYFTRRFGRLGIPRPAEGQRIPYVGSCGARELPALEEWEQVGRAGHEEIGRSVEGNSDGRALCYLEGDKARIEWITVVSGIYAFAEAENYFRLLSWWRNEAGPIR